ncbi:hypothetical protein YB2330_003724 [Saitoella coloradoensis]
MQPFTATSARAAEQDDPPLQMSVVEGDAAPAPQSMAVALAEPDIEADAGISRPGKLGKRRISIQDQSDRLPFRKLLLVFMAMALALLLSFLDSTSVSTALPAIANDFNAAKSISWVGNSFLIANTAFQVLYGRISDIFGRKWVLMGALMIFALGNLLSGFSQNMAMMIVFRAVAGAGAGGINSLAMIIFSDLVSLRERGKYQGLLGAAVAIGGGIGPVIGGAFSEEATWRWVFWFTVPLTAISVVQIFFFLPLKHVVGSFRGKLAKVDWFGTFLILVATIFILVAISGGGSSYAWDSALVIALLVLGGVIFITFLIVEWKVAPLPIMPLRLFKNLSVCVIFIQTFLVGIVYYGNLYYLPLYFQIVRGKTAIESGVLLLPLVITQTVASTVSGLVVSKTGRYNPSIWTGFVIWTIGLGLQTTFDRNTSIAKIVGYLILEGSGIGQTFQTTLVAAQANGHKQDRAVITGTRNFFRSIGGSFGLAICGSIFNNLLMEHLEASPVLSSSEASAIDSSSLSLPTGLTAAERNAALDAYNSALKPCWYMFLGVGAASALLSFFVKDNLKDQIEEAQPERKRKSKKDDEEMSKEKEDIGMESDANTRLDESAVGSLSSTPTLEDARNGQVDPLDATVAEDSAVGHMRKKDNMIT